jgi:exodeoxyribonuclease VII large subunit
MSQLPLFQPLVQSVSALTRYLRELLESDETLQDVWVQGEVSNFVRHTSGHLYFTLKDSSAALRCVMWRSQAARQAYLPANGEAVEAHGTISIYEAGGQYQLYADLLRPAGEGRLYQEFLRLKASLEAEGLFDPERKRPIPAWPQCIGLVTSPTGAAIQDIFNTLRRRYPLAQVVLAPTAVQGAEAPEQIAAALQALNRQVQPDVILLARGGGSLEDLWAFNSEVVARAIFASAAPVITGVGHETDFTIADFVADVRAPTPTAAAELCTPDQNELRLNLAENLDHLSRAAAGTINTQRWSLSNLENRLRLRSPLARLQTDRQRLDELLHRLDSAVQHSHALARLRLSGTHQHLQSLDPIAVLRRGYAQVSRPDGQTVSSLDDIRLDDQVNVRLEDGTFQAQVTSKEQDG